MNGSTTVKGGGGGGGGNGWPRQWWERAFRAILILIAIVAAIMIYVWVKWYWPWPPADPYQTATTTTDSGADCGGFWGPACPPAAVVDPSMTLVVLRRLSSYGSANEVFPIEGSLGGPGGQVGSNRHERYMWYQPGSYSYGSSSQGAYFFLAFQWDGGSYGAPARTSPPNVDLDIWYRQAGIVYPNYRHAYCGSVFRLQGTSGAASTEPTWAYFCPIPTPQATNGYGSGILAFRVFITNNSAQGVRYSYLATCFKRYPRGDACPRAEDEINPLTPGTTGYPSSGYQPAYPPPPAYGPPPSSGYPSTPSGGYSPPYPSASPSSSYPATPSPTMSSPPPPPAPSGGTGGTGGTESGGAGGTVH